MISLWLIGTVAAMFLMGALLLPVFDWLEHWLERREARRRRRSRERWHQRWNERKKNDGNRT